MVAVSCVLLEHTLRMFTVNCSGGTEVCDGPKEKRAVGSIKQQSMASMKQ